MIEIIFLLLGIGGLLLGTELIIKGALNIAEHFKKEDKTDIQLEVIELHADDWIREEKTGVYRLSD